MTGLDSSALVKLIVAEHESKGLRAYLRGRPERVSCGLARAEVPRAVRNQGPKAVRRAKAVLAHIHLLRLDDALLDAAGELDPAVPRGLDAIHLAAARTLGDSLEAVVTYDKRMADAALLLGLPVSAPS
ncbi:MAG: type II toxin-antitoxin system VapC family toxin [Egibacteraceae bacterium]